MEYYEHDYYRKKRKRGWEMMKFSFSKLHYLLILALLLYLFSGCEVVNDIGKRSIVTMPLDNQDNCTWALVSDANGDQLGKVKPHKLGQVQANRKIWLMDDPQDETYVGFQSPDPVIEEILNGNPDNVIPKGCDNWGYDSERIRLRDGYETDLEDIRLRPPDYWDEPDHWKQLPKSTQHTIIADIPGFWQQLSKKQQQKVIAEAPHFTPPKPEETRFFKSKK